MDSSTALNIIAGIVFGATLVWAWQRGSQAKKQASVQHIAEKLKQTEAQLDLEHDKVAYRDEQIMRLKEELAGKRTELEMLEQRFAEKKQEIDEYQKRFYNEFELLTKKIFTDNTERISIKNRENLAQILNPLNDKLKDFEKKIQDVYDKEAQQRFSLKEEIKRLAEINQGLGKEARDLSSALRSDTKIQGNWGEMILERILEKSGLVKNREYIVQYSDNTDEGKRIQPDVLINYPDNRSLIIDSKVSLLSYANYANASTDEESAKALVDFQKSVKAHINSLKSKNYQQIYQLGEVDFIMMFIPIEAAYLLLVHEASELWDYAYENRIVIISPTNLLPAVNLIYGMWRVHYQSENVMEIARQSGALYDKFAGLVSDFNDLGKKLDAAQGSFNAISNKLSEGRGNIISRVEQLKELGAKAKKEIPTIQKKLE